MSKKTSKKVIKTLHNAALATGVVLATTSIANAAGETVAIDLTTGLAGVAVIGGLMASGSLKAVPTYVAWGIKKALSMLR